MLAAIACLAGCAAGSSAALPLRDSSTVLEAFRPDAQHYGNDYVYTAQPYDFDATVYRRKGLSLTILTTLYLGTAAPLGTIATATGWWYLAGAGHSSVLVYRATRQGPTGPVATLDDSGQLPDNVSVTADRRLVAVSNSTSASSGSGSVSVYLNRKSEPSRVLTYGSDVLQGEGIAIDPQGDCFWSFNDVSHPSALGSIVEFSGCSGTGKLVISGITRPGGMVFDASGDLYYVDEASGIYKCAQTSACTLFATGFGVPTNINFDANEEYLWVADATGYIDAVNPQTGEIVYHTLSIDGDPYGIAPSPGS
jgi:hypothetical protein